MKTRIQSLLVVLSILIGACSNDPAFEGATLKMKAITNLSTINGRASATGLEFTKVMAGVRELEFETHEEDDAEDLNGEEDASDEIEFEGQYVVDLINGTSTPDFGIGNIQSGFYDQIEIEMGPILEGGKTIIIEFNSNSVLYEFSTTEEIEIEIEGASGYQLNETVLTNLLVLIDLDALFSTIDLNGAIADIDGVVRINNSSNSEIHNQLLAALETSCDAGKDNDHDDDID